MKKFLSIIITILFLSLVSFSYGAQDTTIEDNFNIDSIEVYANGAVLMDQQSGKILYSKNANSRMYPASTTKLVTCILVLENCNFSDQVTVSYYAVHSVPATYSIANLIPGETFSVKDLLYIMMVGSANDAAFVLAQFAACGGNNYPTDSSVEAKDKFNNDIAKFSEMMNNKVKEIGCKNTNFVNPNGVHNENHYSTPYDLALIGKYAYNNIELMSIVKLSSYSLPNTDLYTSDIRSCRCTNALLYSDRSTYYEYANGMKTGYTDPAGYCIVASACKDDIHLIAVILGASCSSYSATAEQANVTREADCKRLFDFGFENYYFVNLINNGAVASTVTIINGDSATKSLDLIVKDDIKALVLRGEVIDITPKVKMLKFLAPIAKGDVVGTITYNYNGSSYSSDLLAAHDVYSGDYTNFLIGIFGTFVILLVVVIVLSKKKNKK